MEIRKQEASSVSAANAVYTYPDGSRVAILFVRARDAEAMEALARMYTLHGAVMANLGDEVPRCDGAAGLCRIRDDGVVVAFGAVSPSAKNGGHGMLGAEALVLWGPTAPDWMNAALEEGCVWAGLVSEETYQHVRLANPSMHDGILHQDVHLSDVPSMPVLKFTSRRE